MARWLGSCITCFKVSISLKIERLSLDTRGYHARFACQRWRVSVVRIFFYRFTAFVHDVSIMFNVPSPRHRLYRACRPSPRHPTRPDLETEYASAHSVSMVASTLATCMTHRNLVLRRSGW
ncbi:hypothetical protein OE88DRAFT_1232466 [Heliocybe sulcata]|uniref:Uncharacterized protein n=1 Tax=Heliocybe sulcata TaxID=5364 RepID=A0A5C3N6C7_9AGAM|nr:hypothetical protein OE88DRAFT_1232466 [Heliocybe sulcata]